MTNIIFENILILFAKLTNLQFKRLSDGDMLSLPFDRPIGMFSSTLVELHINVESSVDLLCLLDGRLSHLHSLYIEVELFRCPSVDIDMKVNERFMLKQLNNCYSRIRSQI